MNSGYRVADGGVSMGPLASASLRRPIATPALAPWTHAKALPLSLLKRYHDSALRALSINE